MNQQNARDYIPLIEALADGELQVRCSDGLWIDARDVNFVLPPGRYRRKPSESPKQPLEGWQLVPKEPTREMIYAGCDAAMVSRSEASRLYHAMLAAAPKWGEK